MLRVFFLALAALFASPSPALHAALLVTDLRCERAVDPAGIDTTTPRLSWQLGSVERSAQQTAWQVHVATTRAALLAETPDAWDSGRVDSPRQFEIEYQGRSVGPGATLYWRVRVWDGNGVRSAWSPVARWTMAITDASEWKARWITDPQLLKLTRSKLGFSTPPVRDENTVQWLTIDLGQPMPIDSIVLHAIMHTTSERLGFPRWFKVETANDPQFSDATTVADHTKEGINVWFTRFAIAGPSHPARFVRLTATRLRLIEEEEQRERVGRLALRQIEILSENRNVAVGAAVTASAGVEDAQWSVRAVVDGMELPGSNPRATETLLLRREFSARPAVRRAVLFVTGLGSYTVAFNGSVLGAENLLKPAWTNAERRVYYDTHDVTTLVRTGGNAIALTLAGGMYNVPAVTGRYTKLVSAPRALVAFAQLRLEYADGAVEHVVSDGGWRTAPGPTTFAHMYAGEDYDARREPHGWTNPGFDDSRWQNAAVVPGPTQTLVSAAAGAPPVQVTSTLPVQSKRTIRPGVTVYDLGQNAAIMPRIRVRGPAGATVKLSPAELLEADGAIDPASTRPAKLDASWNYTLSGSADGETWQPQFFYHGARYLQVACASPADSPLPAIEALDGLVVHSAADAVGGFSCSNELFNRIVSLVRWAQRSNLTHVLTDCPHRERLGWLEQYHLNGPALRYHFDLARTFAKTFDDMADAQRPHGLIPATAPEYVRFDEGFRDSPEWGSALILAAWQQYVWTGDTRSLQRHYPAMKRYFAYLRSRADGHILSHGLGDWYDHGPKPPGFAQLTPVALTATAIFHEDASVLQRIATALGHLDDAAAFGRDAALIADALNARFFTAAENRYATGSQTANAMPLALGLVPRGRRNAVADALVADVRDHGNGVTAGDVGYRYLLRALGDTGHSQVLFDINNQSEKPGYGYQIAQGATSLAESWTADRTSSQNHFMLGHIIEWLNEYVAGLAPDPASPGFGRVLVRPTPVGDLKWAESSHHSVRGLVRVRWERTSGRLHLRVTVPPNSGALVQLPTTQLATVTEGGVSIAEAPGVKSLGVIEGRASYGIGSGEYLFGCDL